MYDYLLPIGSVVLLKGGIKKLMITGVCQTNTTDPTVLYDYVAVLYPEGQLASNANFMFNHDRISDIIFKGYENPEREDFIRYLNQAHESQEADNTDDEESGDS